FAIWCQQQGGEILNYFRIHCQALFKNSFELSFSTRQLSQARQQGFSASPSANFNLAVSGSAVISEAHDCSTRFSAREAMSRTF
ncbi:hypothetical protein, partial [Pelomonas cellulosilytica]